jgi:hypothetical protein
MSTCPYCKGSVSDEQIIVCPSCDTIHHEECWQSNDQFCSVFGCRSRVGSASGCPWCDEVYLYDDRTTCMNCNSPLMSPAEYSTFIRGMDWVRLDLEENGNPYLTHGYLRNYGITARLEKRPSLYGYLQFPPQLWVIRTELESARLLLKDLSESLLYCDDCGHVLDGEQSECTYCEN